MTIKLVLQKNEKTIFILKCKPPKRSKLGELDIMMDAGKGLYFEQVVAGKFFSPFLLSFRENKRH